MLKINKNLKAQYPETPWMWKKGWAGGKIEDGAVRNVVMSLLFALLFNAISWAMVYVSKEVLEEDLFLYLAYFLCAVGVLIILRAVYAILMWWRFKTSTLELDTFPVFLGEKLKGRVMCRIKDRPEKDIRVRLMCYNHITRTTKSGSGPGSGTTREVDDLLWKQIVQVNPLQLTPLPGRPGFVIPVEVPVPLDSRQKPTDDSNPDSRIWWQLQVLADIPGLDYESHFEVPVFAPKDKPECR